MSGKRKRAEGDREAPTDESSSSKKQKPQPRGENNDELKECIRQVMREEVSNNQSNHTSYHDVPPPAVQGHTPPRERSRWQRSERQRQLAKEHHTKKKHHHHRKLSCNYKSNESNNIVNLSSHNLTPAEQSVLSKGLSFVPTPKNIDLPDVQKGLIKFRAQIANAHTAAFRHSLNETESQSQTQPLNSAIRHYDPSTTIKNFRHKIEPTTSRSTENHTLNFTLDAIQSELMQISESITTREIDNLSRAERKALTSLKENKLIVVNKADKGSTIVVQNKADYIENGLKHLDNTTVYQKLTSDMTNKVYHFVKVSRLTKKTKMDPIIFCGFLLTTPKLQNITIILPQKNTQKPNERQAHCI